ncbi:hypothetical protein Tco_1168978 [Tanacetum coccineum]
MSQDVLLTVMNSMSVNGESLNVETQRSESCDKCLNLDAEFSKSKQTYNDLLKNYSQLEKHCIFLELTIQLNQEIFQKDKSCDNQNALEILEYFEINGLKAQLQDKDTTICKLNEIIKSLRGNNKEEIVNYDRCELETINEELENSVAKLLSENECLCKEINHVKQVFKDQFDSIKKTCVHTKEHSDSLIEKLNLKSAKNEDLKAQIQDKLDLDPLAPKVLQNRDAHIDYLKQTQEQADILWGIVEQAKAKQPLDNALEFACKHAKRIQELLLYVQDTCPNSIKLSAKKVAVTAKNNVKKVKFAEPLTSSSNIKQVESSITSDSNTPVLSSTGLKCRMIGSRKHQVGNTKNKVEAQPRKVNKKNHVIEPICDANVKHSPLNANSELICATCKKSMFDGVHVMCLLDFINNGHGLAKSPKKHKTKNIWKPTGHVLTKVGLKWKPTGRTFTIVGNSCPLTRITSAKVVPPKKTTSHSVDTQKPELKVYRRRPKQIKSVGSSKNAKIVESKNANNSEPNHTWGSNATDIPLSSSLVNDSWETLRNLEDVDLLFGSRDTNLYTISLDDMLKTSLIYLLSKASKTKSWLWHR